MLKGEIKMAQAVTLKNKTAAVGFWALSFARISLGFIFLWAFLDKLFGFGFSTCRDSVTDTVSVGCDQAWAQGGSPTEGFLNSATGPFESWFEALAGQAWVDWLFMIGLAGIGIGLLLGLALRFSALAGSVLLLLIWAAVLWPAENPVISEQIVYIFVLVAIAAFARYQKLSFGRWWQKLPVVRKSRWLV